MKLWFKYHSAIVIMTYTLHDVDCGGVDHGLGHVILRVCVCVLYFVAFYFSTVQDLYELINDQRVNANSF